MPPTARIVPLVNTPDSTSAAASATSGSSACRHLGRYFVVLPYLSVIWLIAIGAQYLPRAPIAAYALATVTGSISLMPSVNVSYSWSLRPSERWMPSDFAVSTVPQSPTCCSSIMKKVFTDSQVPVRRVFQPGPPSSLVTVWVGSPMFSPLQFSNAE